MLTRGLPLLVLVAVAAACGYETTHHVVRLQPEQRLSAHELTRSARIFEKRLIALGVDGTAKRRGHGVVVRLSGEPLPPGLTEPSMLEFFDVQPAWARGPSTKPLTPRPGTELISCAAVCPNNSPYEKTLYFLFRTPPALTGADVRADAIRIRGDPQTGEPLIQITFTPAGARAFHAVTRVEAQRGAKQHRNQDLGIVFGGQFESMAAVDYREYPNGIDSSTVEMTGGSEAEVPLIAAILRAGTLPARFHVVR